MSTKRTSACIKTLFNFLLILFKRTTISNKYLALQKGLNMSRKEKNNPTRHKRYKTKWFDESLYTYKQRNSQGKDEYNPTRRKRYNTKWFDKSLYAYKQRNSHRILVKTIIQHPMDIGPFKANKPIKQN